MSRKTSRQPAPAAPSKSRTVRRPDFDAAFWTFAALVIPAVLLVYQPAWHGGFVWDDDGHVTKTALQSLGGIWRIWFEPGATQQYYPVVHTAFWLQFHLWGLDTTGYHIVNILLHAASACLLVAILRRLRVPGAWLAGAIFALHPVNVESVAWITELKNTLSGACYFAAALAYLHFDERRTRALYWSAFGLFVLALFSKSVTATLPAGLLVVFWWQRDRVDWKRDVLPLIPFLAAGVAVGAMTVWMERTFIGAQGSSFNFTFIERGLIAGRATCFYLASLFWPTNLAFSYARWHVSQATWWQYLFPAGVLVVLGLLWWMRRWSRAPLAALMYFGITLGPALGFVNVYPFRYSFVADHFQYLASVGIIALVAAALTTRVEQSARPSTQATAGLILVMTLPLALLTWRDSHAYSGRDELYRTTAARSPDAWLAHNNLAALLLDQEKPDVAEALVHAREAVRIAPEQSATRFNLGLALEASGDKVGAAGEYRAALDKISEADRATARAALVYDRLASVLRATGRLEESAAETARSREILKALADSGIQTGPASLDAQADAAVILFQTGHAGEAVGPLSRIVQQSPDRIDVRYALGLAYEELNQFDRALEQLTAVIARAPDHGGARRHLGSVLHSLGRLEEAVSAYREALKFDPTSADAHNDLGVALAELHRFSEAETHFAEAVRLKPDDAQARTNLEKTREILRRGRGGG